MSKSGMDYLKGMLKGANDGAHPAVSLNCGEYELVLEVNAGLTFLSVTDRRTGVCNEVTTTQAIDLIEEYWP